MPYSHVEFAFSNSTENDPENPIKFAYLVENFSISEFCQGVVWLSFWCSRI